MNKTQMIIDSAKMALQNFKIPHNSVVVFDIDDTIINTKTWKVIDPIYDFYYYIQTLKIIPIFITARPITFWKETMKQLDSLNIRNYESIYFRNPTESNLWAYKENARKNIVDRGFNVIMSIGDKEWDIGEFGGIGILIK